MSAGDVLEAVGALALIAGGFVWAGMVLGLVLTGVALVYFGQVYQDVTVKPRLPRLGMPHRHRPVPLSGPSSGPMFHCALCDGATPVGQPHRCER